MNRTAKNVGIYLLIFALVVALAWMYREAPKAEIKQVEFSEMVTALSKEKVTELKVEDTHLTATLKDKSVISAYAPTPYQLMLISEQYISPQMEEGTLKVPSVKPDTSGWIWNILPTLVMIGLFAFFWFSFMNQGQGGGKGVMSFGKSRAKMIKEEDGKKVTFADVAGLDEEKAELEEIVDFLKNPKKYVSLGARIPKGVLLVGPPGTGKTYLSKAAAGEAGVPFFTISGSDFVEMFVGVGASRVRDLFDQAKKNAPCIVFIDEIDAVGRRRGAGIGGGNDEREQTLNQLLVEMDGFGVNEGIIILAATNRPDVLDPAILRPGRFDRQVVIGVPDIKGREAILRIHARNKPLDESVKPRVLARRTPGFTPADIENLLNEAALLTARRNGNKIRMSDIEEAITKVIAGPEKKSRVISESERKLTAFHEAGHAVVARVLPNTDPVHQITIMPRGRAGGFTMILPKEDKYYMTKTDMEEQIAHLLGGRVAEMLTLNDISTGASNDLERATHVARGMVTKYGMSNVLGPVSYAEADEVFIGRDFSSKQNYSEEVASKIDGEIRKIIEDQFELVEKILTENMEKLHQVANVLLEIETLDGDQFEELFTGSKTPEEVIVDVHEMEQAKQVQDAQDAKDAGWAEKKEADREETDENDTEEFEEDDMEDTLEEDSIEEEKREELTSDAEAVTRKDSDEEK